MVSEIGFGMLAVALVLGLYGLGGAIYGGIRKSKTWVESARIATLCIFPVLTLALVCLLVLILSSHFEVQYVFEVSSRDLPIAYKAAALWGGQAGSLLFWCWLCAGASFLYAIKKRDGDRQTWVIVILLVTLCFFIGLTIFASNPFERFFIGPNGESILSVFKPNGAMEIAPPDGLGLNPLLQHPAMAFHPPALYIGFTIFLIPFAATMVSLIAGKRQEQQKEQLRNWVLIGWIFLAIGLILGSRWAYDVLGWGGYWGWDPVEIAALMPWLSATALLHNLRHDKGERLSRWSTLMVLLTFGLVVLGTYITRSGSVTSVHAFSESKVGLPLLVFLGVTLAGAIVLLGLRWKSLRSENPPKGGSLQSWLGWLTNAVLMGILLVCLWGVFYPKIAQGLFQKSVMITPAYYKAACGPLFLLLVFFMGICPLAGWGGQTFKQLGKKIWIPVLTAFFFFGVLLAIGEREVVLLVASWVLVFAAVGLVYALIIKYLYRKNEAGQVKEKPYSAWKTALRRFANLLLHLGIVFMAVGIIGMEFMQTGTERTIQIGERIEASHYTITLVDLRRQETADLQAKIEARIQATRDDGKVHVLTAIREFFPQSQQYVSSPALWSTLKEDLYIVLAAVNSDTSATFKIFVNPHVDWLWIGGISMVAGGGLLALERRTPLRRSRKEVTA